jgi:hypothetical protein
MLGPGTRTVAAAVHKNAGQPGWCGRRVVQLVELSVRLEQALLHNVLGILTDQASGQRNEPG